MKRVMFFILAFTLMLPLHRPQAATGYTANVSIEVIVQLDINNIVNSICVGKHGTFLTKNEILAYFDINGDKTVTRAEFESKASTMNWAPFLPSTVAIYLPSGYSTLDGERLLIYMDNAKRYMASLNLHFKSPSTIWVGQSQYGTSYSTGAVWYIASINYEILASKVIQSALQLEYPKLDYTANEAFARYFIYNLLGYPATRISGRPIYNAAFENLTGNDIDLAYQNYYAGIISLSQLNQIIANVCNNNLSLAQTMLEIRDIIRNTNLTNSIVLKALNLIKILGVYRQNGKTILNQFLNADKRVENGCNLGLIEFRFNLHGIYRQNCISLF